MNESSVLIDTYFVTAGIMLYAGVQALLMKLIGRQSPLYAVFSLMCFCAAGYQFTAAAFYLADSIAAATTAMHWQMAFLCAFMVAFYGFVGRYTEQRLVKGWLAAIALLYGAMLLADVLSPYSLRFARLELSEPLRLPWGEALGHVSGRSAIANRLVFLGPIMATMAWALWRAAVQFQRGERRMAVFLAVCVTLLVAAGGWSALIDLGLIRSFYVSGFAFLGFVLLTSVSLGLEARDRARRLEASTVELRQEIERRGAVEQALRRNDEQLRVAATAFETQEGIVVTDADKSILRVNQAFTRLTGYRADEVVGQNPSLLASGTQDASFYTNMWEEIGRNGYWQGEIWNRRKDGTLFLEWLTVTAVVDASGQITNYVGTFSDITERKHAQAEIHSLAYFDPLTKLPNRRLLLDRLRQALAAGAQHHKYGAILFIDLDNFKILNDTKGHRFGDLMLQEVAKRLQTIVWGGDLVARLGGDEFGILMEKLSDQAQQAAAKAELVGRRILAAITEPFTLQGYEHHGSTSIGISLFRGNELTLDELLKHTGTALYQAKSAGRNALCIFDPAEQLILEERMRLEADLRSALARQQFQLYYQMQVDETGRIFGAETLLRWRHPERGLVLPAQFIASAEASGLIVPIGIWVLETACAQIKAWESDPATRNICLAVNVSPRQFRHPEFVAQVRQAIARDQIHPGLLKLELTESLVIDDIDDTARKMEELKGTGVRFSLDDFGTGHSSLAYLTRLPLAQVKIDQSFVQNIFTKSTDAVIVRTIIEMASNLKLEVIAEGVETVAQRDLLLRHGCRAFQGYLFSRPVPLEVFEQQLKNAVVA